MFSIRYLKSTEIYKVRFSWISPHIIQLEGDFPVKTEGFVLLEEGKNKHSCDHPGFTTVYREIEGGVQFSDDGSTYDPDLEMHIPISDEIEEDEIYTGVGVGSLACMDYYQYLLQQEKR